MSSKSENNEGAADPSNMNGLETPPVNLLSIAAQGETNGEFSAKAPSAASEATINVLIVSPSVTAASSPAGAPRLETSPFSPPDKMESSGAQPQITFSSVDELVLQPRHDSNPTDESVPTDTTTEEELSQTLKRSVRFRSRVRITSGVHSHRGRPKPRQLSNTSMETTGSSRSSSPSSSISAPLRDPPDDSNYVTGIWRTGMPLYLAPAKNRSNRRRQHLNPHQYDPRTPLRHSTTTSSSPLLTKPVKSYFSTADLDTEENEQDGDEESEEMRLNKEIDIVFGKWPSRLLNRHWWWWQVEPIVCCNACCLDDSDTEPD